MRADFGISRQHAYKQRSDAGQKHRAPEQRKERSDAGQKHTKQRKERSDAGQTHTFSKQPKRQKTTKQPASRVYGEKYQSELTFLVCGMCGFKGPSSKYLLLDNVLTTYRSGLAYCAYQKRLIYESFRDSDSSYDQIYAAAYNAYTTNFGMLNGAKYVCLQCCKGLKGLNGAPSITTDIDNIESGSSSELELKSLTESESESEIGSESESDLKSLADSVAESESGDLAASEVNDDHQEIADQGQTSTGKASMTKLFIYGLSVGKIPDELESLTSIEISMISLVNPISKMRIMGSHMEAKTPV